MKHYLKIFFIVLSVMILGAVLIGLALGSSFETQASETVAAPPSVIHARVSGFKQWEGDFERGLKERDPTVKVKVEGPDEGEGSEMSWEGEEFGAGQITIVRADPEKGVWFEGRMNSDRVNFRGSIEYQKQTDGSTKVVTKVDGDLPPVIGGYLSTLVEDELEGLLKMLLARIKEESE